MAPLIGRRMGWAEHVPRTGDMRNAYIFVDKSEGKKALPGPMHGMDNIRMNL
jgi:hypothetical protein